MALGVHVLVAFSVVSVAGEDFRESAISLATAVGGAIVYYLNPENEEINIAFTLQSLASILDEGTRGLREFFSPAGLAGLEYADVYDIYFPPKGVALLRGRWAELGSAAIAHGCSMGGAFQWSFLPPVGGGEGFAWRGVYEADDYR